MTFIDLLIFGLIPLFAVAVTSGCTIGIYLFSKNKKLSVFVGTLAVPCLILAGLVYWLITMEVDDAPPGMVIGGNLVFAAIVVPCSLLISILTVWILGRRARSKTE